MSEEIEEIKKLFEEACGKKWNEAKQRAEPLDAYWQFRHEIKDCFFQKLEEVKE